MNYAFSKYYLLFCFLMAALLLSACASPRPGMDVEISSRLSQDIPYANVKNNKLNNNMELWKPISRLPMRRRSGLMRLGMHDMIYKRYFCSTILFGINEKGELVDIVEHNSYGDDKAARQAIETLKRSKWEPTESNPDRKPGVFVLEVFNFRDNDPNAEAFKQNCPFYITSDGIYMKNAVKIKKVNDSE